MKSCSTGRNAFLPVQQSRRLSVAAHAPARQAPEFCRRQVIRAAVAVQDVEASPAAASGRVKLGSSDLQVSGTRSGLLHLGCLSVVQASKATK